jgi:outer membrane biosynthesis protein TonB
MRRTARLALALLACGCARQPPPPPPAPPSGRTSVRPLVQADVQAGVAVPDTRVTPVYPSELNAPPEYPAYALRSGCREGTVAARVIIDEDGNVREQVEVPGRPLPGDACHQAFRTAAAAAVARWKFAPAFRVSGRKQVPVAVHVDFEFLFEVVDGRGFVRSR